MRPTTKGQVTIPIEFRQCLDIGPETELTCELRDEGVLFRKTGVNRDRSRRVTGRLLAALYTGPSTDDLMALTRGDD